MITPRPGQTRKQMFAAARKRRWRKRIKDGADMVSGIPLKDKNGLIKFLIDRRWISEANALDEKKLRIVIGWLLDNAKLYVTRGAPEVWDPGIVSGESNQVPRCFPSSKKTPQS